MRKSTKYKILFGMNIFLIVMWPIWVITSPAAATWLAFLAGAMWVTDIYDAAHYWREIRYYTKMGD